MTDESDMSGYKWVGSVIRSPSFLSNTHTHTHAHTHAHTHTHTHTTEHVMISTCEESDALDPPMVGGSSRTDYYSERMIRGYDTGLCVC